eukprot:scaffold19372_cov140-Isochrysis_galbana.AAC.1
MEPSLPIAARDPRGFGSRSALGGGRAARAASLLLQTKQHKAQQAEPKGGHDEPRGAAPGCSFCIKSAGNMARGGGVMSHPRFSPSSFSN